MSYPDFASLDEVVVEGEHSATAKPVVEDRRGYLGDFPIAPLYKRFGHTLFDICFCLWVIYLAETFYANDYNREGLALGTLLLLWVQAMVLTRYGIPSGLGGAWTDTFLVVPMRDEYGQLWLCYPRWWEVVKRYAWWPFYCGILPLLLMPFFTRHYQNPGDYIAGTVLVDLPYSEGHKNGPTYDRLPEATKELWNRQENWLVKREPHWTAW